MLSREIATSLVVVRWRPRIQTVDEPTRVRVLQDYLDVAILRDLIERPAISNPTGLRRFVRQLMNSPASHLSVRVPQRRDGQATPPSERDPQPVRIQAENAGEGSGPTAW
jgi:hypothetical protein